MKLHRVCRVGLFTLSLCVLLPSMRYAQERPAPLDAKTRTEVLERVIELLNQKYVFPETAKKMEEGLRQRIARKEYDAVTDPGAFARMLTDHLLEICKDKHLRVIFNPEGFPDRATAGGPSPEELARQRAEMAARNFGFEKLERLSGNIGYIDLRGFMPADFGAETVAAAMSFLANTDALILDLRQNGGGDPAMVALISSYLFDKRTHLNDIYSRPENSTEEYWTKTDVPGKRYGGEKPVYVLTSKRTFSAGEEFTYNLKNLKRATIIGEVTGGGAHPVNFHRINRNFGIGVPFARAINPITKTNWEGSGVTPDIAVPAAQALKLAQVDALKKILAKTTDRQRAEQLQGLIDSLQRELNGPVAAAPVAQASAPEIGLPNTPAGKVFGEFIQAFNSGNLETLKKFHRDHGGDEGNAEQDLNANRRMGALKLHRVLKSEEHAIEVLVQSQRNGEWFNFSIGVAPQPPHPIADIRVQPGAAPGEKKEDRSGMGKVLPDAEVVKNVSATLEKHAAETDFSGVVLIARKDRPVFERALGMADRDRKTPNRIDTKFNLGSINKIFTKISILQLIEAGKLTMDDRLGKILPDYPNKQAAEKVTIAHLLNMQSGIGDFFGPAFEKTPKNRLRTINDYLPLFADQPLKFEPGTSRAYSNGGYIVLGAIIEKLTGQSYYDYVREHIFKPAGMPHTDAYAADAVVENMAVGYTKRGATGDRWINNIDTRPARGSSAGGGYSTAPDLVKFSLALQAGKLLNAENTKKMLAGGVGIAGGAPGINATLDIEPPQELTIVVLSNLDPPSAEGMNGEIRKAMRMRVD